METALMKAAKLLPRALSGDPGAQAILLVLGFGYLIEKGYKELKK